VSRRPRDLVHRSPVASRSRSRRCVSRGSCVLGPRTSRGSALPGRRSAPLGKGSDSSCARGRLLAAGGALDARGDTASAAEALEAVRESDSRSARRSFRRAAGAATNVADALLAGLGRPGRGCWGLSCGDSHPAFWIPRRRLAARRGAHVSRLCPCRGRARWRTRRPLSRDPQVVREDRLNAASHLGGPRARRGEAVPRASLRCSPVSGRGRPGLDRAARRWRSPSPAPAVASLLDWDPTGFALVPALWISPRDLREQRRRAVDLRRASEAEVRSALRAGRRLPR
jgi:hypothetical protein